MIYHGDVFDVLPTLDAESIDACVTDPPYGLEFMGKEWDKLGAAVVHDPATVGGFQDGNGGNSYSRSRVRFGDSAKSMQVWHERWAREVFRVLKPGAYLLAFGGTRTYHRMTCAIEDAGFEIRDCLQWIYGSGFPKSLDVSKAIDAAAGAERKVIGQSRRCIGPSQAKGFNGSDTFREPNWQDSNTLTEPSTDLAKQWQGWGTALKPACEPIVLARKPLVGTVAANVERYGAGAINVDACRIAAEGGWQEWVEKTARPNSRGDTHIGAVMNRPSTPTVNVSSLGRWPANVLLDEAAAAILDQQTGELQGRGNQLPENQTAGGKGIYGRYPTRIVPARSFDAGGASRFFYVAKPARSERDYGCDKNGHPTVKPLEVLRWLVRLVTPPDGLVLDPFMGSGSTGMACRLEQARFVGIEREADYVTIARERIESTAPLFAEGEEAPRVIPSPQIVFEFQ